MLLPSRDIKEANVLSSQAKYRRCSIGMWILLFDGDVDRRTSTPRWTSICPPYIYKHLSTRNLLFNLYSQELISACKDKIKYLHPKLLILIHWFWVIWYLSLSLCASLSLSVTDFCVQLYLNLILLTFLSSTNTDLFTFCEFTALPLVYFWGLCHSPELLPSLHFQCIYKSCDIYSTFLMH